MSESLIEQLIRSLYSCRWGSISTSGPKDSSVYPVFDAIASECIRTGCGQYLILSPKTAVYVVFDHIASDCI